MKIQFYHLSRHDAESLLYDYKRRGWSIPHAVDRHQDSVVITEPERISNIIYNHETGKIVKKETEGEPKTYTLTDCLCILESRLEFGNREQRQAIQALNIFNVLSECYGEDKVDARCPGFYQQRDFNPSASQLVFKFE